MSNKHNRPDQQQGKSNHPGGQDKQRHEQSQQRPTTEQGKTNQHGQWNNPKATQRSTDTHSTQTTPNRPKQP